MLRNEKNALCMLYVSIWNIGSKSGLPLTQQNLQEQTEQKCGHVSKEPSPDKVYSSAKYILLNKFKYYFFKYIQLSLDVFVSVVNTFLYKTLYYKKINL